ncbi:MAG: hypothetical protein KF744_05455 [Taibaiella sp.]|nr:hypothetical protein [Taibaiella sp.]
MNGPKITVAFVASMLAFAVFGCHKKTFTPVVPDISKTAFTKKLGSHGTYDLEGTYRYVCWLCTKGYEDTTYDVADTMWIEVLNDSNIYAHLSYSNRLYTYDSSTDECNVYKCRECDGYYAASTITYYYISDSLVYYRYWRTSGNSATTIMHSMP